MKIFAKIMVMKFLLLFMFAGRLLHWLVWLQSFYNFVSILFDSYGAGVVHSIYDDYCGQDLFDYTEGSI